MDGLTVTDSWLETPMLTTKGSFAVTEVVACSGAGLVGSMGGL